MTYLVDTNVLLRRADKTSKDYAVSAAAAGSLLQARHRLVVCAQVLIEFRAVATRPKGVNGLGMSSANATAFLAEVRASFECLPEVPDIADRWQCLVTRYDVIGRQVHDARLAALMLAHGVTHILTLNPGDFARYDGITPVTPQDIHQTP